MKRFLLFTVVALCAVGVGVSGALAGPRTAARSTAVTVAMHDPGCHWFLVGGAYRKSLTVKGPVSLFNFDEAALKVAGRGGTKVEPVGHKLALTRGTYHVTMVGQAPDDNHLLLVVR